MGFTLGRRVRSHSYFFAWLLSTEDPPARARVHCATQVTQRVDCSLASPHPTLVQVLLNSGSTMTPEKTAPKR